MNRAELQQLAEDRILDAKALLDAQRWAGAYYLAGYAVECGLKACIITYLMKSDQFPEKRYSERCWVHNLEQLVELAGLRAVLDVDTATNPNFSTNWKDVKDWQEASRYQQKTQREAQTLYNAITHATEGLLPWIKRHW